MKYRAKLDPKVDLAGATPETLARALLRPRHTRKPVVRDKPVTEQVASDKPGDGISHLRKRV